VAQEAQALDRFQREARAASALNHPNICTIYEIDTTAGPSLAMELLGGQTLKYLITGRSLDVAQVVELGIPLADPLEAAHSKGIVHRDIKPATSSSPSAVKPRFLTSEELGQPANDADYQSILEGVRHNWESYQRVPI
jgi:serine/threonine protein kinase